VRDVLLQVQATIVTKPRFAAATSTRHFSIAVSDYVTSVLMVAFLRKLQCQSPSITCELRPVGRRATEDLESGELDFLIAPALYTSAVHPQERAGRAFGKLGCVRQTGPTRLGKNSAFFPIDVRFWL